MADPATGGFRTVVDWKVFLIDPETEISTETGWELSGSGYFTKVIGDRLLFFGGKVLQGFSIAMLWGLFVGTFSSIRVGMPVLLYLDLRRDEDLVGGAKAPAAAE